MESGFISRISIIILGIVVISTIIILLLKDKEKLSNILSIGISLVVAGGIGNLIDRIVRGSIIDYIDITKIMEGFPVFNIADILIVIGGITVIIHILIYEKNRRRKLDENI